MTKTLDLGCGVAPKNPFNADEQYWHSDVPYWLVWELKAVK